jgi:hypothetical protein
MRPKIAMWSDYGAPRHKHWRTPSRRSSRSSIGPKILAAAVVVVAGIIGISGMYPQIIDSEWMQGAGSHAKRIAVALATTTRRTGIVTTIPLSPRRDATTGEAATSIPRAAAAIAEPPKARSTVAAVEQPANETAPVSADVPDAEAIADPPPKLAAAATPLVAPKVARAPIVKRRVVRNEHHRGYSGAYAQYGGTWSGGNGWPGLGSPYHF